MDTKLRHQVLELKVENRYAEAIELVRPWAASGVVAARVMLARMADEAGIDDDEAAAIVDAAHIEVEPLDILGHLELHSAYEMRLGNADYEVQAARSFEHLSAAAVAGADDAYSFQVAIRYHHGAIAVPVDLAQARKWYRTSIQQGYSDAQLMLDSLKSGDGVHRAALKTTGH
ncbi:hypothetical protein [Roseateles sp.]|jgi:TPR repeat protein|uniref:hypothetical protein n=1 Tax=Roseateles sp. TaxID=1971397 RepID=UPI0031CE2BC0